VADMDERINRLADVVFSLQTQISGQTPGATQGELNRIKVLEDKLATADLTFMGLRSELATLSKSIAELPTRNELHDFVDKRVVRAAELTGEALGTFQNDAREYADQVATDANLIARKEADKARAAAEANVTAATAFIRRSLHIFCS